jgi:hypothetical protein
LSSEAGRWDAELDALASAQPVSAPPSLLQTWGWGEVQARAGWSIERARLQGSMASVQVRGLGPLREAYVPRGPVPSTAEAVRSLIEWARERGFAKLRVEPDAGPDLADELRGLGFSHTKPTQPEHTSILTLRDPEQLLKSFKHGRRYNIRAGLRRGVTVDEGADAAELERQSAAVERRESINLPDRRYYESLLQLLPWCRTFVARSPQDGEALATVLVARHGGRAYSLFAGRSGRHTELMGNDLAWWSAISACAAAGDRDFDFWGVPPPGAGPDHPWHGIGTFKAEFGGSQVAYAGAWEMHLSKRARLLGVEQSTRRTLRRLRRNIS